ncbi:hypothetical protein PVAND_006589 [Polypedilum vanderplanki]|uniref:Uncharacterized protein n=1 Tax=Polypedilum vanderplanki TaxID=319348 RepID=A0A9J6C3P0_POLVA|nr:hypothetical protein PVAND_006589 [Polypedilum vanderplanki]
MCDSNKNDEQNDSNQAVHSRQKRLIWITDDGRLALPPGTSLIFSPTLTMPFVRYPPEGFHSNISISIPLTIDFDKLGLTDNQNPLGTLLARSMSQSTGEILADYVFKYLKHRSRRHTADNIQSVDKETPPKLPFENAFHGGERAILYAIVEDFLSNFGIAGKACVLRTICEVHSHHSIHQYGLLGEIFKLFFTASLSPYAEHLNEYIEAEKTGKGMRECLKYVKKCPQSIFKSSTISSMTFDRTRADQKNM